MPELNVSVAVVVTEAVDIVQVKALRLLLVAVATPLKPALAHAVLLAAETVSQVHERVIVEPETVATMPLALVVEAAAVPVITGKQQPAVTGGVAT